MVQKTQRLLFGAVYFFLAVAFSALNPADGAPLPSPERGAASQRLASMITDATIPTVSNVDVQMRGDKTQVVLDLSRKADFSYKTDKLGTLVSVAITDVDWQAAKSSLNGMGVVLGYYFDKNKNGVGQLDIATSVPVVVSSAFAMAPKGAFGHRIVLDLQPSHSQRVVDFKPVVAFAPHPRKPLAPSRKKALASVDKAALLRQRVSPSIQNGAYKDAKDQSFYQYASLSDGANLPFYKNKLSSPVQTPTNGCSAFPRIPWWKNDTHKKVIYHVASKYYGDWGAYINKWEGHLNNVVGVVAEHKKILIKKSGVIISGEGFIDYVQKIKQRISIIRCLAFNTNS